MKILLAVSGGPDSMCMADYLPRTSKQNSYAIAHCNFHLRGDESDGDEMMVRAWAADHGLECFVADFDTMEYASQHGISIEMAARDLRYAWFAKLARENGFDAVAVAHNSDDNAETLVLNLLRGTGTRGVSGMKASGPVPGAPDILLLRPMLGMSRAEIENYISEYSVPFRMDSSNQSTDFKRNKIRHQVMPVFAQMNPSYLKTFEREMGIFGQMSSIADDYYHSVKDLIIQYGQSRDEILRISLKALLAQKNWEYLLFRAVEDYGLSGGDLDALIHLIKSGSTFAGKQFCSSSYRLITASDCIIITDLSSCDASAKEHSLIVDIPGDYELMGVQFKVELVDWTPEMPLKQPAGVLIADASRLELPFVVRSWKEGDWIRPLGMNGGKKKISDLFTDLKYTKLHKERALIVCHASGQQPVALLGQRIDESIKVSSGTTKVIRISLI